MAMRTESCRCEHSVNTLEVIQVECDLQKITVFTSTPIELYEGLSRGERIQKRPENFLSGMAPELV